MEYNREFLNEYAEGAIILDGYDDCIVGITEEFGVGTRILYSKKKILDKLTIGIHPDEALEYYYFNIIGGYFGEQNPIFLEDTF
jgi:hypothetical protein